jgi:HEAT repeat protein
MVGLNVVRHFLQQYDLRTHRRAIGAALGGSLLWRLHTAIAGLPVPLVTLDGTSTTLDAATDRATRLTVAGPPGSGRRLALEQRAARWAWSHADAPRTLLLALPEIDHGHASPEALVAAQIAVLGRGARPAPFAREADLHLAPWVGLSGWELLLHGWDELPLPRRAAWRSALTAPDALWAQARLIVALPEDEPPWPGYLPLTVAAPGPALIDDWLAHLAPEPARAALRDALQPGGPLATAARLADVALLAWVAPRAGLPASRAELYERFLGLLDAPGAAPRAVADTPLLTAYRLARHGAPLAEIAPPLRCEVARFAAALAPDLAPLLEQLLPVPPAHADDLEQERPDAIRAPSMPAAAETQDQPQSTLVARWRPEDVLTAAACLLEHPAPPPAWVLRIAAVLAHRADTGPAGDLLAQLEPRLSAALGRLAQDEPSGGAILGLLRALPAPMAERLAGGLLAAEETAGPLGWALADRLAGSPPDPALPPARRAYLAALAGPAGRAFLASAEGVAALRALADSEAGAARRLRVAGEVLADSHLPLAPRVVAVGLLAEATGPEALALLARHSADPHPAVRAAALDRLAAAAPQRALDALRATVLDRQAGADARLEAVRRLMANPAAAGDTLVACAADAAAPLAARLLALRGLSEAPLLDLLHDPAGEPIVRAGAARRLAALGGRAGRLDMLVLLDSPMLPPVLAGALCAALGASGDRAALAPLLGVLERAAADVDLTLAAIDALERLGDMATAALGPLLGSGAQARLATAIGPFDPQRPAQECQAAGALPPPLAARLARALAGSATIADPPTSLGEFVAREADAIRGAAARALARIGGAGAANSLAEALRSGETGGAAAALVEALAALSLRDGPDTLATLLHDPVLDPLVRWRVAERLAAHPESTPALLRGLEDSRLDPFTRGALAEGLGQRGAAAAMALRRVAGDSREDEHLRGQALRALGRLGGPVAEAALLAIAGATHEPPDLRAVAAESLPAAPAAESRAALRALLHGERPAMPLARGALRALGRAGDREALPLLLRYCQDGDRAVATAAIDAMAQIGDPIVTPMLVRLAHDPHRDPAARLQAAGALLRLGGQEHRPLIRAALEGGTLPLRLQALEHLLDSAPARGEVQAMLADVRLPLPLRLRLFAYCAAERDNEPALRQVLENPADDPDLRGRAAEVLRAWGCAPVETLLDIARAAAPPDGLRLRCVAALGALGGDAAMLALSRLAIEDTAPAMVREEAAGALLRLLAPIEEIEEEVA